MCHVSEVPTQHQDDLRCGEELKTFLIDSQTFWAGRMSFVLKNKKKRCGESFHAYSLGGCKKWPAGIPDSKRDWKGRAVYTMTDRGTCQDNPFRCSLTFVYNIHPVECRAKLK